MFSIAIQATASRTAYHENLKAKLPPAKFAVDNEMNRDVFATFKRALLMHTDAPYHLILQDDVDVCVDFIPTIELIISHAIRQFGVNLPIVSPYASSGVLLEAKSKGVNFIKMVGGSWGQARLFPVVLIEDFLAYCDETFVPEYRSDDGRFMLWSCEKQIPFYVTAPSLVQHIGHSASLIGYNNKGKVSPLYAGEESPLVYAWDFDKVLVRSASSLKHEVDIRQKSNTLTPAAMKRFGVSTYGDGKIRRQ